MKNRASAFLKHIITVIKAIAKAKSALVLKNTKISGLKSRLLLLSLLRNKKVLLSTITHKLHAMLPRHHDHGSNLTNEEDIEEHSKAIVPYDNITSMQNYHSRSCTSSTFEYMNGLEYEEDEDKYPDLTHTLFDDLENDPGGVGGSVIEMVKNSKEEGEEFVLEDEIDQVADLFIKRFHRQIFIQKQLSFKRYQEMLERSV